MSRRVYSPAISEELIRPLYWYAQSVSKPMTKVASSFVARGLLVEALPQKAIESLPDELKQFRKSKGLEAIAEEAETPMSEIKKRSQETVPYRSHNELQDWYEQTIDGLAKAMATVNEYRQYHSNKPPQALDEWYYENAAFTVATAFYQASSMLTTTQMPSLRAYEPPQSQYAR